MSRGLPGVPPGRAGRLWLRQRLAVANRGLDLLDRKLRILRHELLRRRLLAERTGEEWEHAAAQARTWLLRAALLGGQRAVHLAGDGEPAALTVAYEVTMGVRYPARVDLRLPPAEPLDEPTLAAAREAHRVALSAAVRHAASTAAVAALDAEVAATRSRLRAVKDRWIPRLTAALAEVELSLEELEHADGVRLRQAAARRERR